MDPIYARIRKRARRVALSRPMPDFYKDFPDERAISLRIFQTDPLVEEIKSFAYLHLNDDLGHGIKHTDAVALDTGALMIIEGKKRGLLQSEVDHGVRIGICAALCHDIKRKEKEHAKKGAIYARQMLAKYPSLSLDEINSICDAIRSHTAFKDDQHPCNSLISNCLYDADKFRWGPDNFTDTVWLMASFFKTPLSRFVEFYPMGMDVLRKIKKTFRTETGKQYGPGFIDEGIAIGEEVFELIQTEFMDSSL